MLKQRILTALILIPLFLALLFWTPPLGFGLVTLALTLLAAWEWAGLMELKKTSSRALYVILITLLLGAALRISIVTILGVAVFGWIMATFLVVSYPKPYSFWEKKSKIARGIMGIFVLIPCWVSLNFIRNVPEGSLILLFLFVLIWGADSGAYFMGKFFGKKKLLPLVSPGKTWEGFYGALLTTLVIALIALTLSEVPSSMWIGAITLSLVTVLFSIIGDLFESLLKREAGVKDSGRLLPGHGGILDRIDSLTAAAPIFAAGALFLGSRV